jgi:hypothetical protein
MADETVSSKITDLSFFQNNGVDQRRNAGRVPVFNGERIGLLRKNKAGFFTGYMFKGDTVGPNNRVIKLGRDIDLRRRLDPIDLPNLDLASPAYRDKVFKFEAQLRQAPNAVHDAKLYALARVKQITGLSIALNELRPVMFARDRALETYGVCSGWNEAVEWVKTLKHEKLKTPKGIEKLVDQEMYFNGIDYGEVTITLSVDDSHVDTARRGGAPDCPHVGWEILFKSAEGGKREFTGHVFVDIVHATRPNSTNPERGA